MKFPTFACAALLALPFCALAAPAQTPTAQSATSQLDARAVALFDRAVAAYAQTPRLSQTVKFGGMHDGKAVEVKGIWAFERPGRARLDVNSADNGMLVVGNGKTTIAQWGQNAMPLQGDAVGVVGERLFIGALSPLALIFQGINPLLFELGTGWQSAALTPDGNGVVLKARRHPTLQGDTFRVFFDPQTHLITRVENEGAYGATGDGAPRKYTNSVSFIDNPTPLLPAAFEWVPPAGKTLESMAPPVQYDARLTEGAQPLPLIGKTLDGETIVLDDYRGKVVLLDFWATWCEPCVDELPTVHDTYRKYHDDGFEIIGISSDMEASVLRAFIAQRAMPWPQIHELMSDKVSNGRNYGVRGIPFAVLIGRDGKIAAMGLRGWHLPLAVEKALAAPAP